MKPTMFDLGDARNSAKSGECKIISFLSEDDSYFIRIDTPIDFICKCGKRDVKNFKSFISNTQCSDCSKSNIKYSIDEIRALFKQEHCILKTKDYINANQKLYFVCLCGEYCYMSLRDFKLYRMCKKCFAIYKNRKRFIRWNEAFLKQKCVLLTTDCKRVDQDIKYLCKCGRENVTQFYRFKSGQRCMRCRDEEHNIGEKHRDWKGGVTPENTKIRTSIQYKNWRESVLQRDSYTCQCCNIKTKSLQVHHIDSFADFPHLRYVLENGITMCFFCHSPKIEGSFHHTYGTHNNNIFELQEYFNDIRISLNLPLITIEKILFD